MKFLDTLVRRSALLYAITHGSGAVWLETAKWLGFNLVGSLFPLWGTYILLRIQTKSPAFNDFVVHGEFAVYAAAFIAPSLWVILRNMKEKGPLLGTGAVLIGLFALLACVAVYSGILLAPIENGKRVVDEKLIRNWSVILFGGSLIFAIIVAFTGEQQANPKSVEAEEQTELADRVASKQPPKTQVAPITDETTLTAPVTQEELKRQFNPPEANQNENNG